MKLKILSFAAALTLLLSACGTAEPEAPPLMDSIKVVYDTAKVERGDVIATLTYSGYVVPKQVEAAFEEMSGTVDEVFVKPGDIVEEGTALLKLDTESLRERLSSAEKQLSDLTASGEREKRLLEISLELAELDYAAAKENDPDSVETSLAELEVRRQRTSLESFNSQLSRRVSSARETVQKLKNDIEESTLRAPATGEVLAVYVAEGSRAASKTTLVSISDGSERYITCSATDRIPAYAELSAVWGGEKHPLERWEYDEREAAAFEALDIAAPPRFVSADGADLPENGEFIQILAVREQSLGTLRIPVNALYRDSGVTYVYIVSGGEMEYTEVKTGAANDAYVEILSGLAEGDEVYVGG